MQIRRFIACLGFLVLTGCSPDQPQGPTVAGAEQKPIASGALPDLAPVKVYDHVDESVYCDVTDEGNLQARIANHGNLAVANAVVIVEYENGQTHVASTGPISGGEKVHITVPGPDPIPEDGIGCTITADPHDEHIEQDETNNSAQCRCNS